MSTLDVASEPTRRQIAEANRIQQRLGRCHHRMHGDRLIIDVVGDTAGVYAAPSVTLALDPDGRVVARVHHPPMMLPVGVTSNAIDSRLIALVEQDPGRTVVSIARQTDYSTAVVRSALARLTMYGVLAVQRRAGKPPLFTTPHALL